MRIITLSREFGSGGRELAKRLSDYLEIPYFDREIIHAIAKESGLDENYVEDVLERRDFRSYPITFSRTLSYMPTPVTYAAKLLATEYKIVKEIASRGDCIIVGRAADAVLSDYKPLKIFVYADMEARIKRSQERAKEDENLTDKEMERKIKQIDKERANRHDIIASERWGNKSGYDLCINTTNASIKSIVPAVGEYAKAWFK